VTCIPGQATELPTSNATCETLSVRACLTFAGDTVPRKIAACLFIGDAVTPAFASNEGFDPVFVRNGVGDYSLSLLVDPGPGVALGSAYLTLDGLPGVVTFIPGPGSAQILMNHLDGTPVDGAFSVILFRNPLA
jgi:hypothetical protein